MAESDEQSRKMDRIISKAWSDEVFKKRLLSDPASVLEENGITIPEGITVEAVENTDKVFHLVIPPKPTGKLSDEQLQRIAGGSDNIYRDGKLL